MEKSRSGRFYLVSLYADTTERSPVHLMILSRFLDDKLGKCALILSSMALLK